MRTNIYAYTENHHPYPAFVSVNREDDGRVTMTVRQRGESGNCLATIDLCDEQLDEMAAAFIDIRGVPESDIEKADVAFERALARAESGA